MRYRIKIHLRPKRKKSEITAMLHVIKENLAYLREALTFVVLIKKTGGNR